MIQVGQPAPDFTLPDELGNAVTLRSELARGPVVVYFYPRDFTPVCTAQACMFRDEHARLAGAGVNVLGISGQGAASHAKFKAKHALPFRLLADEKGDVARAFGCTALFGLIPRRATFFIDRSGVVRDRAVADLSVASHKAFVERVIAQGPGASSPVAG
ncbi:MAG: peroxiredoxin [Planctomycetota bacterium]|nr:peroxiredoxin [Planctomycetota bacterium]